MLEQEKTSQESIVSSIGIPDLTEREESKSTKTEISRTSSSPSYIDRTCPWFRRKTLNLEKNLLPKQLFPIIDGDIIVYRCGFAAKDDEPLENVLHSVKLVLDSIVTQVRGPVEYSRKDDVAIYITGKGNFREKRSTIREYKGNRKHLPKPKYFKEIREYLTNSWYAITVEGCEADDAIGQRQYSSPEGRAKNTCICSIDKDLNMIPGWHYNFLKKELYYVPLADANLWFWWQLMTGDSIDNIQGIPKIGPRKASKVIEECDRDENRIKAAVEDLYRSAYGDRWYEVMKEMADLVWIRRKPNEDGCPLV